MSRGGGSYILPGVLESSVISVALHLARMEMSPNIEGIK